MTSQPAYTDADVQAAVRAGLHAYSETLDKRFKGDAVEHEYRAMLDAVVPAIVARAKAEALAPVRELLKAWDEIPDYMPSHYDRGRVDQRHMAAEELATVLERADEIEDGR